MYEGEKDLDVLPPWFETGVDRHTQSRQIDLTISQSRDYKYTTGEGIDS